jgi:hypothetical protein
LRKSTNDMPVSVESERDQSSIERIYHAFLPCAS